MLVAGRRLFARRCVLRAIDKALNHSALARRYIIHVEFLLGEFLAERFVIGSLRRPAATQINPQQGAKRGKNQ